MEALGTKPDLSRIPERYAITWFEEATKQDDPEIQELFAKLLARAASGDVDAADRRILSIVGDMTPDDAVAFASIYEFGDRALTKKREQSGAGIEINNRKYLRYVGDRLGSRAALAVEHLRRLGLAERYPDLDTRSADDYSRDPWSSGSAFDRLSLKDEIYTTDTAWALYRALGLADLPAKQPDRGGNDAP